MVRSSRLARLAVFVASVAVVPWAGVVAAGCGASGASGNGGSADASLPPCDSCSEPGNGIDPSSLDGGDSFYDGALFAADGGDAAGNVGGDDAADVNDDAGDSGI